MYNETSCSLMIHVIDSVSALLFCFNLHSDCYFFFILCYVFIYVCFSFFYLQNFYYFICDPSIIIGAPIIMFCAI